MVAGNDDDFFETDLLPDEGQESGEEESDDEGDCFEKWQEDLPDLPEENDPNWPQENECYFSRKKSKKYVRTDKYSLLTLYEFCKMLPKESKLPTIMSAFKKQKPKAPKQPAFM